jgi:hypothetical protein
MPMNVVPPPLPARNAEQPPAGAAALSSSLPLPRPHGGHAYYHPHHHPHQQPYYYRGLVTSPTETASSSEYHVMSGLATTPLSSPDTSNYLPMDMGSSQVCYRTYR